jgi:hypothetical protein
VRGTAFEGTNETTVVTSGAVNNRDLHTSLSPRVISSTTTSTVNWQVGDRLVIEIGVRFVTSTTGDQAVAAFSSSAEFIGDIVQAHSSAYVDRRPWISIGEPLLFGPPTDAEEFRYGLDGYPLNGNTSTLPFVDFERIDGLDSAPIRSSVSDREGQHGGFATAEFEGPRTVTLEGRLYCAPSALEAELDRLKANFSPTTIDKPLFFGTDTGETRLVRGKSLGVRYVKDRERGIGVIKFQIQIVCQDPRIYLGAEETFTTSNTLTVAGNRETPLRLSLRPSTGTINNPSVTITNALGIWTISYTGSLNVSSDEVTLDMGARTAILNGSVNVRHLITLSNGWASLSPGANTFAPSTNLALDKYYQPAVW